MSRLEKDREFWKCASGFPPNKELVYPGHAQAQRLGHVAGKDVLEYGCGGGADAMSFLRWGARTVTLCDIVPHNVQTARDRIAAEFGEQGLTRCAFRCMADSIDLPSGDFDVVASHGVLHHLPADAMEQVLVRFRSLLRPNGVLVVMLYTESHYQRFAAKVAVRRQQTGEAEDEAFGAFTDAPGCIARWYTEVNGRAVIAAAGFAVFATVETAEGCFRTYHARPA